MIGVAPVLRCYTGAMPTVRPRHTLTETPELADALDAAALVWPELRDDRGALLRRLVEAGRDAVATEANAVVAARRAGIAAAAGSFTGVYPPGYLDDLRREWPE